MLLASHSSVLTMLQKWAKRGHIQPSSAMMVVAVEVVKLFISVAIEYAKGGEYTSWAYLQKAVIDVFNEWRSDPVKFMRLCLPRLIGIVQSNLNLYALRRLDATTYQIASQMRIITGALFAVLLTGKIVSRRQWFALILLVFSLVAVQWGDMDVDDRRTRSMSQREKKEYVRTQRSQLKGGIAAMLASICSGFLGVYNEVIPADDKGKQAALLPSPVEAKINLTNLGFHTSATLQLEEQLTEKKGGISSFWAGSVQNGFQGVFFAIIVAAFEGQLNAKEARTLFTVGRSVWTAILFQSIIGMAVSAVVGRMDNIRKSLAQSLSIAVSATASYLVFREPNRLEWISIFGWLSMCYAVLVYSFDSWSVFKRRRSNSLILPY